MINIIVKRPAGDASSRSLIQQKGGTAMRHPRPCPAFDVLELEADTCDKAAIGQALLAQERVIIDTPFIAVFA